MPEQPKEFCPKCNFPKEAGHASWCTEKSAKAPDEKTRVLMQRKEEFGNPDTEEKDSMGNIYKKHRDEARAASTELQNGIADVQEAKLGLALRELMRRTDNNPGVINGLNHFLDALGHRSIHGNSDRPLGPATTEELGRFLEETSKALRWMVGKGNRPSDLKIDLSEWEQK